MRDKIYQTLRNMDTSKTIDKVPKGVKNAFEACINKFGKYELRLPDSPCKTCLVQALCQIKKIYDLGDLNIVKTTDTDTCEKIELWTEIVKGEELKKKFYEESRKRKIKNELHDDRNHYVYLAMSINNLNKLEEYIKLLQS